MSYHQPVLLSKTLDGLSINPDGVYVDVTFGGGGHSKAILSKLNHGKLFAFDQDADAIQFTDALSFNFSKSVADAIGVTESFSIGFNKALTESISFSDSATTLLTINRAFSDSVSVGDSFSKLLEIGLPLSDGMAIDDAFSNVVSTEIQKSNVVGITESLSINFSKALTETATVTDAISLQYDPNFSHSVTMSESFSTSFISGTPSLFNNPTMNTATFNG